MTGSPAAFARNGMAALGWAGLVALAVVLLMTAAAWEPDAGWRAALRGVPTQIAHDPVAALYVAVAAGLTGVVTWMLFLLLVPALGCAVLAAVAAPHRRGR